MKNDKEALFQNYRKFIEGTILQGDFNITLSVVAEDAMGIGMGEQGYYTSKNALCGLFKTISRLPENTLSNNTISPGSGVNISLLVSE